MKQGNTDGDVVWRENRARPLAGGVLCYLLSTALMFLAEALRISMAIMFSHGTSMAVVLLISTRWKISIYAIGAAELAVALSYAYFLWDLIALALPPPVV